MAFQSLNVCRSFNQVFNTVLAPLSGNSCSEVIIYNRGANPVYLFDNDITGDAFGFILSGGENFTIRGVTNSYQVSAKTATGTSSVHFRTQYYSNTNLG